MGRDGERGGGDCRDGMYAVLNRVAYCSYTCTQRHTCTRVHSYAHAAMYACAGISMCSHLEKYQK